MNLKNPLNELKNLSIKHDMAVDKQNNEILLQDIANEKKQFIKRRLKNLIFTGRGPIWDSKVVKI